MLRSGGQSIKALEFFAYSQVFYLSYSPPVHLYNHSISHLALGSLCLTRLRLSFFSCLLIMRKDFCQLEGGERERGYGIMKIRGNLGAMFCTYIVHLISTTITILEGCGDKTGAANRPTVLQPTTRRTHLILPPRLDSFPI